MHIRGFPNLTLRSEADLTVRIFRQLWDGLAWEFLLLMIPLPFIVIYAIGNGFYYNRKRFEDGKEVNLDGSEITEVKTSESCFGRSIECLKKIPDTETCSFGNEVKDAEGNMT